MISFYPGPSRVHDAIPGYVKDAFKKGILSINHRSEAFTEMMEETVIILKEKLNIPADYTIFFTSSATECWEIIAQSLVTRKSHHVFNGAFGEKWYEYTKRIAPGAKSYPFNVEELINPNKLRFTDKGGVICITQNETSNGTQVSNDTIRLVKGNNPEHLIAVDATSSMAGIELEYRVADIWFASVQKCFGLPAGLALMACSARTIEAIRTIDENKHYNSLTFMTNMMEKWQTPYTPNVLNIYLLMRVMDDSKSIKKIHLKTKERYDNWIGFLKGLNGFEHFVKNKDAHSYTVIPVTAAKERIAEIKKDARKAGLLLGEGYGQLKDKTFRIANFPALKKSEIRKLQKFLRNYF